LLEKTISTPYFVRILIFPQTTHAIDKKEEDKI
jgi:hypothetical protein